MKRAKRIFDSLSLHRELVIFNFNENEKAHRWAIKEKVEMSRLFKQWVNSGILEQAGNSKKSSYYIKLGTVLERDLISKHLKLNFKSSRMGLK